MWFDRYYSGVYAWMDGCYGWNMNDVSERCLGGVWTGLVNLGSCNYYSYSLTSRVFSMEKMFISISEGIAMLFRALDMRMSDGGFSMI